MLCAFWLWHVYSSMFWAIYAAFSLVFSGVLFLHTVNFVTAFVRILSRAVELSRFIVFVIVCTHLIHIFVIVWHFKAQSNFSQIQIIYKFYRGHETSLV